jgi:hypothetical protein
MKECFICSEAVFRYGSLWVGKDVYLCRRCNLRIVRGALDINHEEGWAEDE